ncbi:leucine-rich repeat domain-containing protein [Romboutsia sp. 1001713B170131_170501_G6]|uniref:leucine-rich repeat domain-containing protein n=1 Tax=Romboutsia sp. 1001713B170131_170501_G6 TaxID=2787108 RepID=UPI0018A91034|nr:leucine-rich repeat domain-containing protein [Romboutsia sp. 1001713B170131_170501_G6]
MKDMNDNWIDGHLKYVISSILGIEKSAVTKNQLKQLEKLDLSDKNISSLKGIEYAINLKSLNLCRNEIRDASLLSKLINLNTLELSENKIEDVSFLSDLVNLKSIGLDSNNISKISNLVNLTELQILNISNNQIQDLTFLDSISSDNIKIIASDQYIMLNPVTVYKGQDYIFNSPIHFSDDTIVLLDNIQVRGNYNSIKTDKRPSILYSISKVMIKNILSNCLLKADFYHEVPFSKSTILSGTIIQQINLKIKNVLNVFEADNIVKISSLSRISGNLFVENRETGTDAKSMPLKEKIVTIIDSNGNKAYSLTNENGLYEFKNLRKGRYTLLFPFLDDYEYTTPSLVICNLTQKGEMIIDSRVYKK